MFGSRRSAANETKSEGIGGVYAAAVTPHRREGHEADYGAMLELVDDLAQAGVDGICLLGSTGEFLHIKPAERIRLLHLAAKRCRVPILAGVSHSTIDGVIELADEALNSGARALLLMPPYFFRYSPDDIETFYRAVADAIEGQAPLFAYNIPQFTNGLPLETLERLIAGGVVAGVKDSSGDAAYLDALLALKQRYPFTLMVGNDKLLVHGRRHGADGAVSGVACAAPQLIVELNRAIVAHDEVRVEQLEAKLQEFIRRIEQFPAPVGIKVATAARGRTVGPASIPLSKEKQALLEEFQQWFQSWLPTVTRQAARAK